MTRALVVLALIACGRREPELDQPVTAPADATPNAPGSKKLGEACGVGAACASGLACMRAICELACGADKSCPTGTTCQSGVCRRR
ncbi:MAG: hypothetical protein ABI867_44015 [Kofleriaceae bacterium]